jgi:hypothetical protein
MEISRVFSLTEVTMCEQGELNFGRSITSLWQRRTLYTYNCTVRTRERDRERERREELFHGKS